MTPRGSKYPIFQGLWSQIPFRVRFTRPETLKHWVLGPIAGQEAKVIAEKGIDRERLGGKGPKRPHKHKDPTNLDVWNSPCLGL